MSARDKPFYAGIAIICAVMMFACGFEVCAISAIEQIQKNGSFAYANRRIVGHVETLAVTKEWREER